MPDSDAKTGDAADAAQTKDAKKQPPPAPDPEKLTLTQADLDAKVNAAIAEHQRKADAKAEKERAATEADEAKKRGEHEKVAIAAEAKAAAFEAENRKLKRDAALTAHLAAEHPEYLKSAKYIAALIADDTEGDELDKAVKTATAEFIKNVPAQAKGGTAGAPGPRTPGRLPDNGGPRHPRQINQRTATAGVAASRF